MQVIAFSTPARPDWRWRILNYAGEMIEESSPTYPSVGAAVAAGAKRLREMSVVDLSVRVTPYQRSR